MPLLFWETSEELLALPYLLGIVAIAVIALCLWRWDFGLYSIVVWDVIRDPVRKLLPGEILPVSGLGGVLWLSVLAGYFISKRSASKSLAVFQLPRTLIWNFRLLGLYLVLGTAVGSVRFVPLNVLLLGMASALAPVPGFFVGRALASSGPLVYRLLALSCLLNSVAISSAFLDLAGMRTSILGGIQMEWYRMREGYSIPLPSGIFRSPDVLGVHVAHAFAFACILSGITQLRLLRRLWQLLLIWAGVVLVFAARRKMVGFCGVFLCSYIALHCAICRTRRSTLVISGWQSWLLIIGPLGVASALVVYFGFEQLVFAATTLTELPQRASVSITASLTTIEQSGFWGQGLGFVTQGRSHVDSSVTTGWQEDGLSRFVMEAGVLGGILAISSLLVFFVGTLAKLKQHCTPQHFEDAPHWRVLNKGFFSLLLANVACGMISHLHISGDPVSLGFVGLFAGCLWPLTSTDDRSAG
jgi:hypothetical protein